MKEPSVWPHLTQRFESLTNWGLLSRRLLVLHRRKQQVSNAVMKADFHGAELYGSRIGNIVYVALKPIVEAMGLDWTAQRRRVQRDPQLQKGMAIMAIPSGGGMQETVGLDLDLLPGWLFRISSLRIKNDAIRAKIEIFQRECYAVLAKHFLRNSRDDDRYTHRQEMRSIHMVNAALRIGGPRAGLQVWRARGLPEVPALGDADRQGDLFDPR